jgi:histidinol phosphatase-like PHP family hydrolase
MKFKFDHDLHLHSYLSLCSEDPLHTNERILQYAKERGLHTVCLANHFWDEKVAGCGGYGYEIQNFPYVCQGRPVPKDSEVKFLFGCETEMNKDFVLGISKERMDEFDFIVVPTTHLHFRNFTLDEKDDNAKGRAKAWVERLDAVLNMDLPFHKMGIAHLTCGLTAAFMFDTSFDRNTRLLEIFSSIPQEDMDRLFKKAAKVGVGIEIHSGCMSAIYNQKTKADQEVLLRPYRIAKENKCKFYCGTDAHKVCEQVQPDVFDQAIEMLGLEETDKFDMNSLGCK